MDIGSWLLLLAILILVGLIVSRPFLDVQRKGTPVEGKLDNLAGDLADLTMEKEILISSLQDLDNDHELDRIPEENYATPRQELVQALAEILRRMDDLEEQLKTTPGDENTSARTVLPLQKYGGDEIETLIAERRRTRNEKSAGFCPHCGKVIQKSDQFCPSCGSKVSG